MTDFKVKVASPLVDDGNDVVCVNDPNFYFVNFVAIPPAVAAAAARRQVRRPADRPDGGVSGGGDPPCDIGDCGHRRRRRRRFGPRQTLALRLTTGA